MPLVIHHDIGPSATCVTFDHIEFSAQDEEKYYRLTDSEKGAYEIRVKYIPDFISERNPDRYECFLFENPYLTAENDVFEIKENTLEGRLGWIFPITALDSNENNFVENESFKHYRYIAYCKLLTLDHSVKITEAKDEFRISELFQGISVCILSKDEIAKINGFNITDYALSFLKYDYLIFSGTFKGKRSFKKDSDIESLRKKSHKIKIKKAAYNIISNEYTKALFIDHVYQTENILTKYILLYQILEQFIQEHSDLALDEIIKDFQDRKITKNTLREKIVKIQSDRGLIKKIFRGAILKQETKSIFLEKCTFLFNDIQLNVNKNFEDAVYDLRNLITHNYRLLTDKENELNELVFLFEQIIFELLITFNEGAQEPVPETKVEQFTLRKSELPELSDPSRPLAQKAIDIWNSLVRKLLIRN